MNIVDEVVNLRALNKELVEALKRTVKFIKLGHYANAGDMLDQAEAAIASTRRYS